MQNAKCVCVLTLSFGADRPTPPDRTPPIFLPDHILAPSDVFDDVICSHDVFDDVTSMTSYHIRY